MMIYKIIISSLNKKLWKIKYKKSSKNKYKLVKIKASKIQKNWNYKIK